MPISRLLLMRQRNRGNTKGKEGSPGSPLTPGSPDCKGQRFFGSNMTKKRSLNGTSGDQTKYGTKSTGKHKQSKLGDGTLLDSSKVVIIISCTVALFSLILYGLDLYFNGSPSPSYVDFDFTGGWRMADDNTTQKYGTDVCDIDRKWSHELTLEEFEKFYRYKKPVVVKFTNGAKAWTNPSKWTLLSLKRKYGEWSVMSGNSREIVRRGGTGDVETSFRDFVDKVMRKNDNAEEPDYLFDRHFYSDTSLPDSLKVPPYFQIKDDEDDSIFFLGSSASGVSFHKHADAWNGVVYGRKRWFLYPIEKTPPGGVYPGFTTVEWFDKVLPHLSQVDKPIQCIQEPGEILYLPEGIYHATINIGETVAVGIQKKLAATRAEMLFYEENEIAKALGRKISSEKRSTLLKRKKEIFESLLELLPDNSEVHMKAGQMYKDQGDLNKSLRHTGIAVDLDQFFLVAVLSQADIHSKLGHEDKADQLYKHVLSMNPRLWDVYAQYGDFLINHNRPEEAAVMYRKGTELLPRSIVFWTRLKLAQERAGDIEGAELTQKDIDRLQAEER